MRIEIMRTATGSPLPNRRQRKEEGFYCESVGYQRKGMNDNFWNHFYSKGIFDYALREDFEHAFSCVDFYWEEDTLSEVQQRKELFKKDFIDKFELGASFINLSY